LIHFQLLLGQILSRTYEDVTLFLDKKQNKKEREGQCLPSLNLWIMTELDVETIGSHSSLGIR